MTTRRRSGAGTDRFSRLVLTIRENAGLKQSHVQELTGIPQPKLSRVEQGKQWLRPDEAKAYAAKLGATPDQRRELVELAEAGRPRRIEGQPRLTRRAPEIQQHVAKLEQTASLIRSWQPLIVPGVLQIHAYERAAADIPADAPAAAVAEWTRKRDARRALLDDPDRRLHALISEAVLQWTIASHAVMADQLEHLLVMMERPNVTLGVVPFGPPAPPAPATFHLYDDRTAEVDTLAGTTFLTTPPDLDLMATKHALLSAAAVHDDAARAMLERVRDQHRAAADGTSAGVGEQADDFGELGG